MGEVEPHCEVDGDVLVVCDARVVTDVVAHLEGVAVPHAERESERVAVAQRESERVVHEEGVAEGRVDADSVTDAVAGTQCAGNEEPAGDVKYGAHGIALVEPCGQ